jgi:hypothetical protein
MRTAGLAVLMAVVAGCGGTNGAVSMAHVPIVVPLDKATTRVSGFTWPVENGRPREFVILEREGNVTVAFPSGRQWTSRSRPTFVDEEGGIVSRVVVTPLRETLSFDEAVLGLSSAIDQLNVDKGSRVRVKLEALRKAPPEWSPFATESLSCEVEAGIELFAEIRPANRDNQWFLSYGYYVNRFFRPKADVVGKPKTSK